MKSCRTIIVLATLGTACARSVERSPVWEKLAAPIVGCTVERLANPAALELFHWDPCGGTPRCTEAAWNPALIDAGVQVGRRTVVSDDGEQVRVAVSYSSAAENGVLLADQSGAVLSGLRVQLSAQRRCGLGAPSLGNGRFATVVLRTASGAEPLRVGGVLASLDHLEALVPFEVTPLPPGLGPDETAMGTSRWLWRFSPDRLATLSNVDGSGPAVFATLSASIVALGAVTSTGGSFLFDVVEARKDGGVDAYVGRSDGARPPERFISGAGGAAASSAMFAHSHLAWSVGGRELWASPAAERAADLQPYRVGELPGEGEAWIAAGWGRCASANADAQTPREVQVWNLAQRTSRTIALPSGRYLESAAGLTRTGLWVVPGSSTSSSRGLMRLEL